MVSLNWQELLATYWPHIVAAIAGLLGWNNRAEIKAWASKTPKADANGIKPKWGADQPAPGGTTAFVSEVLERTEGMPADKVVLLLATEGITPDAASKAAAVYFRGQAKP